MNIDKSVILFEKREIGKIVEIMDNNYSSKMCAYRTLAQYRIEILNSKLVEVIIEGKSLLQEIKSNIEDLLLCELFDEEYYENVTFKWE